MPSTRTVVMKKRALTDITNTVEASQASLNLKRARKPTRKARETAVEEALARERTETDIQIEDVEELFVDAAQEAAQAGGEGRRMMGIETAEEAVQVPRKPATMKRAIPPGPEDQIREMWHMLTELMDTIGQLKQRVEQQGNTIDELTAELADSYEKCTQRLEQRVMPMNYAAAAHRAEHRGPIEMNSQKPANETDRAVIGRAGAHPAVVRSSLFCTIEAGPTEGEKERLPAAIRQGVQEVIREEMKDPQWKCLAVKRDTRTPTRVRILCRNEKELDLVREAAEKTKPEGARVLRAQLYPVRIDNTPTAAILTPVGRDREDAVAKIETENKIKIAKLAWLSGRETGRAYGSMVVYFTRGEDAATVLNEGYLTVAGESAHAAPFAPRMGPVRCYKCQQIGHKAFNCKGMQTCAKCSNTGHHHNQCKEDILKCAVCGGPHEAYSKNCAAQALERDTTEPSLW